MARDFLKTNAFMPNAKYLELAFEKFKAQNGYSEEDAEAVWGRMNGGKLRYYGIVVEEEMIDLLAQAAWDDDWEPPNDRWYRIEKRLIGYHVAKGGAVYHLEGGIWWSFTYEGAKRKGERWVEFGE